MGHYWPMTDKAHPSNEPGELQYVEDFLDAHPELIDGIVTQLVANGAAEYATESGRLTLSPIAIAGDLSGWTMSSGRRMEGQAAGVLAWAGMPSIRHTVPSGSTSPLIWLTWSRPTEGVPQFAGIGCHRAAQRGQGGLTAGAAASMDAW